jgi:hypothetical protein
LRNPTEFEASLQEDKLVPCFLRIVSDPRSKLLLDKLPVEADKDIADVKNGRFNPHQASFI